MGQTVKYPKTLLKRAKHVRSNAKLIGCQQFVTTVGWLAEIMHQETGRSLCLDLICPTVSYTNSGSQNQY